MTSSKKIPEDIRLSKIILYLCYKSNKNIMENLSLALNKLQENVIGLFKPHQSSSLWMIIENDGGLYTCITIGNLGGLQTLHVEDQNGIIRLFPDGKSLVDMKADPFGLDAICKSF